MKDASAFALVLQSHLSLALLCWRLLVAAIANFLNARLELEVAQGVLFLRLSFTGC